LRDHPEHAFAFPEAVRRSRETGFIQHIARPADCRTVEQILSEAPAHETAS
jgi:hypothetical protein